jgi:hypothetical protein
VAHLSFKQKVWTKSLDFSSFTFWTQLYGTVFIRVSYLCGVSINKLK